MLRSLPLLAAGLQWTVIVSILGMVMAFALSLVLVAMRRSRHRFLRAPARIYTEIVLGIPILVLLFIVFFVLPQAGLVIDPLPAGLITLMLYYSPYLAEVIRGALNAVPQGQIEAARTIGMSRVRVAQRIVAPQAIGLMLPPMTGLFIGLTKDTAILSVISVAELTFQAKQVISRTYAPFEIYVLVAAGYWILTFVLETSLRRVETSVTRYRRV